MGSPRRLFRPGVAIVAAFPHNPTPQRATVLSVHGDTMTHTRGTTDLSGPHAWEVDTRGSMVPRSVREAALYFCGDDSRCSETQVSSWPDAAKETIAAMLAEMRADEDRGGAAR